jgi:murein DD-endopeptidase MepM/ murein hydrolase activator NlpD
MIEGMSFKGWEPIVKYAPKTPKYSSNSTKTNYLESDGFGGKVLLQDNMDGVQVSADDNVLSLFSSPVKGGTVTSATGERQSAGAGYRATRPGYQFNSGTDVSPGGDKNAYASYTGKVVSVNSNGGYNDGFGNSVILEYDINGQKMYNRMSHFDSVYDLKPGQTINQGEKIGVIGSTGNTTGVHLDNELYYLNKGKKYFQDTSSLFKK